jgi:hypothetical protein
MVPIGALGLSVVGWVLMVMTFFHLLSGDLAARTCQTGCVRTMFWAAAVLAVIGVVAGLAALLKEQTRLLGGAAFLVAAPLSGIAFGIVVIGTMG